MICVDRGGGRGRKNDVCLEQGVDTGGGREEDL
jgi:hypothetical protein